MPVVLAAIVLVPIVELYVLIQVGQAIGARQTIVLVLATSAAGAWLLRREGARALRHFQEAVQQQRDPSREVADGVLVLVGGLMLLVPGFVSDVLGLLLLLPLTRALLRGPATAFVGARLQGPLGGPRARRRGGVVDGEVVRDEPWREDPPTPLR